MLPPNGFDSTAAAELHATTVALKYTIAIRTLQNELDLEVAPTEPTQLYTDAQAVTDGSSMERMNRGTRWLAAKYAMVRWGIACRAIALGQVSSEDQIADIVTKAIVGTRFYLLRARVLGLRHSRSQDPHAGGVSRGVDPRVIAVPGAHLRGQGGGLGRLNVEIGDNQRRVT